MKLLMLLPFLAIGGCYLPNSAMPLLISSAVSTHDPRPALKILNDRGGSIIDHAIRVRRIKVSNRRISFNGRCDSACTLLLSLPKQQTCITHGASFGFHLPYGGSESDNKKAARYIKGKYPQWVRSWIRANGGLTNETKIMTYSYASRHLPKCSV